MKITLVGMGSGAPGSLTAAGLEALRGAELIIGARRLLENLPEGCTANRAALYKTDEICALLRQTDCAVAAVVFSGDTGFYSGAAALCNDYCTGRLCRGFRGRGRRRRLRRRLK